MRPTPRRRPGAVKHLRFVCLSLMMVGCAAPLLPHAMAAEKPDPPRKVVTDDKGDVQLGSEAEKAFQDMFNVCLGYPLAAVDKKQKNPTSISAIPKTLAAALPLDSFVNPIEDVAVANAFGYIYTESQKQASDFSTPDPKRLLRFDYTDAPSYVTTTGIGGPIYNKTCGTAIAEDLSLKGGYTIPVASVQAALKSDYRQDSSFSINIGSGQFQSPLDLLIGGSGPEKLQGYLLMWEWYQRHPDEIGKNNYRISAFDGFVIFEVGSNTSKMTVSGQASASVSVPVASLTGSLSASLQMSEGLKLNRYFTGASLDANGKPKRIVVDVVSLETLEGLVTAAQFKTLPDKSFVVDQTLYPGTKDFIYQQVVAGIPDKLCDPAFGWKTDPDLVSLDNVEQEPNAGSRVCAFTLHYKPDDAARERGITLNPKIVHAIIKDGTSHKFTINTTSVSLASDDFPKLMKGSYSTFYHATPVANPAGYSDTQVEWKVRENIPGNGTDTLAPTLPTAPNGLRLECGEKTSYPATTALSVEGSNPQSLVMSVSTLLNGPTVYATDPRYTSRDSCELTFLRGSHQMGLEPTRACRLSKS